MPDIIDSSLFCFKRKKFNSVENEAIAFSEKYSSGIIQDDIFTLLTVYSLQKSFPLEIIRFPIDDEKLCGFTSTRQGTFFVYINSFLPLEKQIFAAAHELYHIIKHFEKEDDEDFNFSSLLTSIQLDDDSQNNEEDREANAFAALLLAPSKNIKSQLDLFNLSSSDSDSDSDLLKSIIRIMDIFAIPYKTAVMRLLEIGFFDVSAARKFLSYSDRDPHIDVLKLVNLSGIAKRWQEKSCEVILGSLEQLVDENKNMEILSDERINQDKYEIDSFKREFVNIKSGGV